MNVTRQFDLDGSYDSSHGEVRYASFGEGPPLIMVHGTPWSSFVWRNIVPSLTDTHTVYVYDLVGYGQSEKYAGQDVSLGIQNDVLAELVGLWDVEDPAVVGHDFGGATVLRAHLLNGVQFSKIALLDAVSIRPWGSSFYQHIREHQEAFADVPEYVHRAIVRAYVQGAFHRGVEEAVLDQIIEPWLGTEGQPAFYRQIAQNGPEFTDEVEDRYGEIEVPALILWGEEDEWLPVETGRRLLERLPSAEFESIPDSGHLVQEDAPEDVTRHLSDFL